MATVRDADRILVMHGGQIVQEGTFEALETQEGLFRMLVHAKELIETREVVHA